MLCVLPLRVWAVLVMEVQTTTWLVPLLWSPCGPSTRKRRWESLDSLNYTSFGVEKNCNHSSLLHQKDGSSVQVPNRNLLVEFRKLKPSCLSPMFFKVRTSKLSRMGFRSILSRSLENVSFRHIFVWFHAHG